MPPPCPRSPRRPWSGGVERGDSCASSNLGEGRQGGRAADLAAPAAVNSFAAAAWRKGRSWGLVCATPARLQGEVLRRKGARVGSRASPLERTVMKLGNPEIARQLLRRGADPDLKDRTGFAVLHDAARAGFLDTLQTLLEFNANVNVEDAEGNLPLHLAAQEGHLPVVAFLLERTASRVGHRNRKGDTAYDLAQLYRRSAVAKLLEGRAGGSGRTEGADGSGD
ncbi:cyclin-dependent kinase 4 inhibitor C isoform X1 [Podarcis raffonei]|nr:cyclin-dependent kinase 4 inhibitor C isoform X1 [Podarcis raffonei]